ncbi:MAG: tRNA (guanosine(46)-N7)-methyltransferase TrmB [Oscillospiraceae bacterium]
MRMRKKHNLEERIAACSDVMLYMQNQNEHANDPLDESLFFDSMKVFGNNNPLHLEIGCGKGAFVLEIAQRNPDINYVAIEKTPNVLITGMERLKELGLKNVRFCLGQAEYLDHLFREGAADRLYLNFSCPFPKETYARHRLTHTRFLEIYRRVLKKGAEIHQKTDNMRLFEFSIEHFSANGFVMKNVSLDLHKSGFEGNIMTEYETRFTSMGLPIYRLEAVNPG